MVSKICAREGCGVIFKSYPSQNKKYCSNECRYACAKYRDSNSLQHGKHSISEVDEETKLGLCSECGSDTPVRKRTDNGRWRCKTQIRRLSRLQTYGLSDQEYQIQLLLQENCCAICGEEFTKEPCVDHNHDTGQVRALLCNLCNSGLGAFRENLEYLENAKLYVQAWDLVN